MKYKTLIALILCAIVILLTMSSFSVIAKFKTEDEIKFRQSAMMFMRWNMGKIKQQVVKNPQRYNKDQVIAAANVIAAVANSGIGALFKPGSETGEGWKKTRLKEEYFSQPDEVKKRAKKFTMEANQLVKVAGSGDVGLIKDQFNTLFKACKGCHKKFREKE